MIVTKDGRRTKVFHPSGREDGFTINELLIVLLIISVLVAIALPNGLRQLQLYRLETSVSNISNKLSQARMNAIKRNRSSWLRVDPTARTVQVRSTDTSGTTTDVGYPELLPKGVSFATTSATEIAFDSMGRYSSGTQSLTIIDNDSRSRKDITISPAGKVSVGPMYVPVTN